MENEVVTEALSDFRAILIMVVTIIRGSNQDVSCGQEVKPAPVRMGKVVVSEVRVASLHCSKNHSVKVIISKRVKNYVI